MLHVLIVMGEHGENVHRTEVTSAVSALRFAASVGFDVVAAKQRFYVDTPDSKQWGTDYYYMVVETEAGHARSHSPTR